MNELRLLDDRQPSVITRAVEPQSSWLDIRHFPARPAVELSSLIEAEVLAHLDDEVW